ncbi:hypothetical protein EmuJ_000157800 [Echinococcus multilocularis]|uniref:Uncharacterized protein n=1 Tax=Echinococcus multilocularis TaxID=6211 RepID=A0A077RDC8_ECHMU|nr:hypothetical protein EmuJ_000157200 [Echinococcus multilocularis]CDI97775.1 hypothetical protein EmuJ_000157800 [Echinococcus multilocularis]
MLKTLNTSPMTKIEALRWRCLPLAIDDTSIMAHTWMLVLPCPATGLVVTACQASISTLTPHPSFSMHGCAAADESENEDDVVTGMAERAAQCLCHKCDLTLGRKLGECDLTASITTTTTSITRADDDSGGSSGSGDEARWPFPNCFSPPLAHHHTPLPSPLYLPLPCSTPIRPPPLCFHLLCSTLIHSVLHACAHLGFAGLLIPPIDD